MTREEFEAVKSELTGLFRKSDLWSIGAKSFANLWRAVEYIGVILSSREAIAVLFWVRWTTRGRSSLDSTENTPRQSVAFKRCIYS